jgi:hypothetical protein
MSWHVLTVGYNLITVFLLNGAGGARFMSWGLLSYTELSKDYVQNIFDVHYARDFAHGLGSIAQFLCAQNDVLGRCDICGYLSAERVGPDEPWERTTCVQERV